MEQTSTSTYSATHLRSFRGRTRAFMRRVAHIIRVLARFGLVWALYELDILPRPRHSRMDAAMTSLELPERVRLALEELGATAIKLGQSLASRGDLIPEAFVRELRKLQDSIPAESYEDVQRVIREDLGAEIDELFEYFEPEPRAAASIGQVHFATLRGGQRVAVKVQRPHVAEEVETDLHILMRASRQAERSLAWAAENHVQDLVRDFVRTMREELDFLIEARNTERLRANLADDEGAFVPSIISTLTTHRVLVIDWVDGAKPGAAEDMLRAGVDITGATRTLFRLMSRQILRDGYFHGDPHAGNVLFTGGANVAFLDCGNAVAIDRATREGLISILQGALSDDAQAVCDYVLLIGAASERTDTQRLVSEVARMLAQYQGFRSTADLGIGDLLDDLLGMVMRHGIQMQPGFAAIAKSLMVTEGVCLQVDPHFDSQAAVREVARDAAVGRLRPERAVEDAGRFLRTLSRYAQLLPRQWSQLMGRVQGGGLKLRISHENLERPLHRLDLMVNRIVFALVVSAIISSSTSIIAGGVSGHYAQYLTYGLLTAGVLLGGWLLYSILRSGRL